MKGYIYQIWLFKDFLTFQIWLCKDFLTFQRWLFKDFLTFLTQDLDEFCSLRFFIAPNPYISNQNIVFEAFETPPPFASFSEIFINFLWYLYFCFILDECLLPEL